MKQFIFFFLLTSIVFSQSQETSEDLKEVFVMKEELSGDEIMERVIQNMDTNYPSDDFQISVLQRITDKMKIANMDVLIKKANFLTQEEIKNLNQKLDTLKRISKDMLIPTISENTYQIAKFQNEKIKWTISECFEHKREEKAENVVKLIKEIGKAYFSKLDTTTVYRVKSGIFPVEDSLSISDYLLETSDSSASCVKEITDYMLTIKNYNVIKHYKDYKFSISKIQKIEGEPTYVLTFQPNKFSAKYAGTLYVSADTYAVTRLECDYAEGRNEHINLKFLMGIKHGQAESKSLVIYKKQGNYYFPTYGRYSTKSDAYVNRNFKLIGKNKSQQKRDFSKIKMKFDMDSSEVTEYIFKTPLNISQEELETFK